MYVCVSIYCVSLYYCCIVYHCIVVYVFVLCCAVSVSQHNVLSFVLQIDAHVACLGPLLAVGGVVVDQDALFPYAVHLAALGDADEVLGVDHGDVLGKPVDLALLGFVVSSLGENVAGHALRQQAVQQVNIVLEGGKVLEGVAADSQLLVTLHIAMIVSQHAVHVPVVNVLHWCVPLALDVLIIAQPCQAVKPLLCVPGRFNTLLTL